MLLNDPIVLLRHLVPVRPQLTAPLALGSGISCAHVLCVHVSGPHKYEALKQLQVGPGETSGAGP
jgi:hypothetical protein